MPPFDLNASLLPEGMSDADLEAEARKVYFQDLVPNPPQTPVFPWLTFHPTTIANSDGGFRKIFGRSEKGTFGYGKTSALCRDRMRHAHWIRPIIEMRTTKTKIYVNNHTMGEWGDKRPPRKRLFVATGVGFVYVISLLYLDQEIAATPTVPPAPLRAEELALSTAFPVRDHTWFRKTMKGSVLLGPPFHG